MTLIPRNRLFDLDHFLDPVWPLNRPENTAPDTFSPRVDITEKENAFAISAELPGVSKEDIKVSMENGVLSIEAEMRSENVEKDEGKIIRQERHYGSYLRRFDLGTNISESDIHAHFSNGVLQVDVPKKTNETHSKYSVHIQ